MNKKSDLLNQLKIDRSQQDSTGGVPILVLILLMLLSLLIGGAGGFFAGNRAETQSDRAVAPKIEADKKIIADTNKSSMPEKILNASGYITARRIATVSAEVMGLITEVNVEEGMSVKKGQILARLDDAVARVNLNFAVAQKAATQSRLGRIRASLAEAKRVLKRAKELNAKNYSSEAVVSSALANKESLEADLMAAMADITVARLEIQRQQERLDNHTITAPFDGVVTVKNAQPGEIVAPSSAGGGFTRTGICTIVDMNSLEIEVDVNEAFIGRVFAGQKIEAHLDAYPDWTIPASVIAVIPTADRAKATVRVRIRLDVKDSRILPDMGVKVAFLKK